MRQRRQTEEKPRYDGFRSGAESGSSGAGCNALHNSRSLSRFSACSTARWPESPRFHRSRLRLQSQKIAAVVSLGT